MGLFDFLKKGNSKSKNGDSRNQFDFYTKSIPSNIKSLLYIADKRTVWNKNQYNKNGVTISFQIDSDFEPSEIITTLPVKQGDETTLGYYPSYYEMTPEQRFKYLTFLTDISIPVDIGYVFVFYYGLERNIYLNKNLNESIDMIITLQKHHTNKSFMSYSNDAIIYAAMKMKDPTILYKLNLDNLRPELLFLVKGSFIGNFTARDLILMSKAVGFTNQRYIRSHPELFEKVLTSILEAKYSKEVYELNQLAELDTKKAIRLMLANISIPEREFQYPNLLLSSKIHSDIYLLIKEAHEKTKLEVAELRKGNPEKNVSKRATLRKKR